ncbi:hypothetical protein [Fusobacterium polymorphum]|uniref:hypothetical protein n=1 Tax=Fusobacterium nucleatum subsp. polymorphum TaxID=76857 RepID=UPI0030CA68AC
MKTNAEILDDLKKELENNKNEVKEVELNKDIPKNEIKNNNFKKKKKKNKFKNTNNEIKDKKETDDVLRIKKEVEENFYLSTDFLSFKEDFLKNEKKRDFLTNALTIYRSKGFTDIDNDKYLELKMKNPSLVAFVMEASFDEIQTGITGHVYFIKPLYQDEYREFKANYGDEQQFPNEFLDFTLKKCVLYPEITDEEIKKLPAGRAIAMCHTIKVMSDLTKKFQIIEV